MQEFCSEPGDSALRGRLRSIVGPAKIIIVVRNQIRLIESLYLVRAKGFHCEPLDRWLKAKGGLPLQFYKFYKVSQCFAEAFGRENVAVFPLEELKADPKLFARRICEFIGVDPTPATDLLRNERRNMRVSQRYLTYSKLRKAMGMYIPLGCLLPRPLRNGLDRLIRSGEEASIALPSDWIAEIERYYRCDNRQLAEEWRLPIERYGYPV